VVLRQQREHLRSPVRIGAVVDGERDVGTAAGAGRTAGRPAFARCRAGSGTRPAWAVRVSVPARTGSSTVSARARPGGSRRVAPIRSECATWHGPVCSPRSVRPRRA
jgi:hypothetical protein